MISKNHPHTPTHIHTCTHSLIHMCTHIHTPTHMPYTYTCTHTHTLTQVHTHTHTPACTCTPTHMCTYLYAQIFNKLHFLWTLTWFFSESFHNSPPIICWSKKKKSSPSTWVVALCAVCKRQITETVVMGGGADLISHWGDKSGRHSVWEENKWGVDLSLWLSPGKGEHRTLSALKAEAKKFHWSVLWSPEPFLCMLSETLWMPAALGDLQMGSQSERSTSNQWDH